IKSESLIQASYTFLPDCIWVWIFSTTSPSWMTSFLTLMPVISSNAFASVRDSYSCTVSVSETALISMPLKGAAALMNHCISFIWSSLERVDGWNSLSIHFLAAASSAAAGELNVGATALHAPAARIITALKARDPFLLTKLRMLFLRCSDYGSQARVDLPDLSSSPASDRAKHQHGR